MNNNFEFKTEEKKNNNQILLLIIGVATILLALVGGTLAFFTANVDNSHNQSVTLTTAKVKGVEYVSADALVLEAVVPGAKSETTFTITNPNATVVATYSMKLVTDLNQFSNEEGDKQLLLTVSEGQLTSPVVLDLTNGNDTSDKQIVQDINLLPGETDTYKISIEFVYTDYGQNTNQNKTYVGHIEVAQSVVTTTGE